MNSERLLISLYHRAPPWLQSAATSARGLALRHQRHGRDFHALLAEAERLTWATAEELLAERVRLWDTRLRPVVARIAAYGRRDRALDQLAGELPVLRKADVQGRPEAWVDPLGRHRRWIRAHSSGTTGAGLRFYTTRFAVQRQWAWWWRYRRWHGLDLGEWCGVFGGREVCPPEQREPPFWRVNLAGPSVLFSQYHLTPARVPMYLAEIRRRRLRWLHGYPSLLALLAQAGVDAGLAGTVDVRWITVGAENLLAHQREAIERMFGVPPRQHYGLAEAVANLSECPEGRLHIDEDFSSVELVPDPQRPGAHRIIGTTLDNDAMPLLRYDTGDVARLPSPFDSSCRCARPGRVVASIDGRQEDYVVLSDGSLVGRLDHLFKDAVHVAEAQIVQDQPGQIVLRIVRGQRYRPSDEQDLRAEARQRFGDRLRIDFDYVDALPRSNTGKLRLVISNLERGRIVGSAA